MTFFTSSDLSRLAQYDSATVANAIEKFQVRDQTEGYASMELICRYPELQPFVGYAITCTADSTSPQLSGKKRPNKLYELYKAIDACDGPVVVVMQDLSPNRLRSCHAGDVMSTIFQRLGAVSLVTDGGVRDLAGIRQRAPGLQVMSAGVTVSHGVPTIVEVGIEVAICGLRIRPGDLLHGDANGLVKIPHEIATQVGDAADDVLKREAETVAMVKAPDFTLQKLADKLGWH
ncbi:MAG: RraA family protein [Anaerolineae bacterium]|nr:RraA family protein [Anaerolineae bacterium]